MPEPKYLTMPGLQDRWSCSHMYIERKLREDPDFPRPVRFGPSPHAHRRFKIADIEQYERQCAGPQAAKRSKPKNPSSTTERARR
jgi:hypothetical protein